MKTNKTTLRVCTQNVKTLSVALTATTKVRSVLFADLKFVYCELSSLGRKQRANEDFENSVKDTFLSVWSPEGP